MLYEWFYQKNSEINRQKFDDYRGLLRNLTEEKNIDRV